MDKVDKELGPKSSTTSSCKVSKFTLKKSATHFYLHDKYLPKIPKLSNCHSLSVLYLHNNEICEIENLDLPVNLISLYLQKNRILKIEKLDSLRKLKKLYLGHNTISVVEGLDNLKSLEELHLEKQYLREGSCLCFDPRSLMNISATLQVLNISHNKIQSISCLAPLRQLRTLDASHNELGDPQELCQILGGWFNLRTAAFAGNPLSKRHLYRENIIASCYCLETLDDKQVSAATRSFMKKLFKEKAGKTRRKSVNLADKFQDLPKNYPISVQKAVSASIIKESRITDWDVFNEDNAVFIPWKALPKPPPIMTMPLTSKHCMKGNTRRTLNTPRGYPHLKI